MFSRDKKGKAGSCHLSDYMPLFLMNVSSSLLTVVGPTKIFIKQILKTFLLYF